MLVCVRICVDMGVEMKKFIFLFKNPSFMVGYVVNLGKKYI
jgi:hypothetical protein